METTEQLDRYRGRREWAYRRLDTLLRSSMNATTTKEHVMSTTTSSNTLHLDVPAGAPWIDFTRELDAPVAAVFQAHRDPEKVKQWLGPRGYEIQVERWDFVAGGGYRYAHVTDHGTFGFRGVFHEVRENEFALQTFEFDGAPDEVALEFMWFEDLGDGRTRLRGRSIGRTVEGRDAMVASGMEQGMVESYERLEELVTG